ncbi:hypothetical protein LDENG_00247680, partial [Lucifuga dentata]
MLTTLCQRKSDLQNQSGGVAGLSEEEPSDRKSHFPQHQEQLNPSSQSLRYDDQSCQTDRLIERPHNAQEGGVSMLDKLTSPATGQYDYYNQQYACSSEKDFISNKLHRLPASPSLQSPHVCMSEISPTKPKQTTRKTFQNSKSNLQKLLILPGANLETYKEMKRKNQERVRGMPRFGIEVPDHEALTQVETEEIPLERLSHRDVVRISSPASSERPGAPLRNTISSQTVAAFSVKDDSDLEDDDNGHVGSNNGAKKRKHKADGGISDTESNGKKRKLKTNMCQDQMDQLLAVSLREEELSQSLQEVEKSLIQARNALQAAYAEVQRLMLLKHQFNAEVNSLRAKRIEILQGMQGYFQKASTSSAASVPPNSSAASSAQQASASASASLLGPPQPTSPAMPAASIHAGHAVLSTSPTLLPPPSPSATPQSTTSTNSLPSTKPSVKQLEWEVREGLRDSRTTRGGRAAAEVQSTISTIDSDSEEKTGNGFSKGNEPTGGENVSTFVPRRENDISTSAPGAEGGNESDASMEMVESSNLVVIDIDESENEDTAEKVSNEVHPEPPPRASRVESRSTSTQTFTDNDRKIEPLAVMVSDATLTPPASVEAAEDEEPSLGAFESHSGPVNGLQVHDGLLYTCSGDNTARAYSLVSRECQAVFEGHTNKVNCLLVSSVPNMPARLYTGSSDQTITCYGIKTKKCLEQISLPDRVLCLHIAWNILYAGLANGSVASYDLKTLKQLDMFECHGPRGEGAHRVLLVGSYDSTISIRDARTGLLLRTLEGHSKTVLCMKVVNNLVFSGSSDMSVQAHNIHTSELVRIYKGHPHAITAIVILGKVMVTACLDKLLRVYELQSHDHLQVYGSHSDMVMCMAIHKSMHPGSKAYLMKNHRCWWTNCSLIFGVAEHLVQHL